MTSTIRVTFVESSTGAVIGNVALPPDQMPDTFEIDTTIDLGTSKFEVVRAEPVTKSDYVRSGSITIHLREIKLVDPHSLLFSLPTIEDELPEMGSRSPNKIIVTIHEDDWRQLELVSLEKSSAIIAEFQKINEIIANRTESGGYRTIHTRKLIKEPLWNERISLQELQTLFNIEESNIGAVSFLGNEQNVAIMDGYAMVFRSGLGIFGQLTENFARQICLTTPELQPTERTGLSALMARHNLCLVDWTNSRLLLFKTNSGLIWVDNPMVTK